MKCHYLMVRFVSSIVNFLLNELHRFPRESKLTWSQIFDKSFRQFFLISRLLDAALTGRELNWTSQTVGLDCSNCNNRKLAAKKSSEKSDELFLTIFIAKCGPIEVDAMVIQVRVWLQSGILLPGFLKRVGHLSLFVLTWGPQTVNSLDLAQKNSDS